MPEEVALRKESVDRNSRGMNIILFITVALRKESVDRNMISPLPILLSVVALRKESVDRNKQIITLKAIDKRRSPQGERG